TTTSSNSETAGSSTTSIFFLFPTLTSCTRNPTDENTSTAFSSAILMLNKPLALVVTPVVLPFNTTLTFSKGVPSLPVTLPVMITSGDGLTTADKGGATLYRVLF